MVDQDSDAKKRFDDVYRALMVIGPVLSFAFSNYASSNTLERFVYTFGYPALMTSIIIWGISHSLGRRWEYYAKCIGYVIIWYTFLVLAGVVYVEGELLSSIWYEAAAGLAIAIIFFGARTLTLARVITIPYEAGMVAFAILLAAIVPFVI
ncbi:MAG: hypothetical protein SA339_13530 [Methanomassiliicoccus sp.]|nr:hypothetical protein [Methanomassiliicoccus sp.]